MLARNDQLGLKLGMPSEEEKLDLAMEQVVDEAADEFI